MDNTSIIDQILNFGFEKAKLLGYNNYVEVSMETKMTNVEKTGELLEKLRSTSWDPGVQSMVVRYQPFRTMQVVSGGGSGIGNDIGCDYDFNRPKKSINVDNVDHHQVAMQSNFKNRSCGYTPENAKCKLFHWCGD